MPRITAQQAGGQNRCAFLDMLAASEIGAALLAETDDGYNVLVGSTPSMSSGFGSSPSIVGNNSRFIVTVGSGGATSGTVTFNTAQPFIAGKTGCQATDNTTNSGYIWPQVSSTALSVSLTGTFTAGDNIVVSCGGYQ